MIDKIPRVFISYSWTSEEYKQKVYDLACQLRNDGVEVVLDEWDLNVGNDIYAFMERSVTDDSIDRVLILCDKIYTEKANSRKGGVGDETAIITPELYGKVAQDRFIPIIMERDEVTGKGYMPAYLGSRVYVDLSGDSYAKGYEQLLRIIFGQPAKRRPALGKRPAWLTEDESSALYPLKQIIHENKARKVGPLKNITVLKFLTVYIDGLKPFYKGSYSTNQEYLDDFAAMKDHRDVFLDFVQSISDEPHFGSRMAEIFEKLYNELTDIHSFVNEPSSYSGNECDIFKVHIWELFICSITFMLQFEMFDDINEFLVRTYYLKTTIWGDVIRETSYEGFRYHSEILEQVIKPKLDDTLKGKFTLTGHLIVSKRELKPIFSRRNIANADLFLYQVYNGLGLEKLTYYNSKWFPTLYIYSDDNKCFWNKLKSKRFCEKIMPVFGVTTISELKNRIGLCHYDERYRYAGSFDSAVAILNCIKVDEIATLP